jgi:hypothetical protein
MEQQELIVADCTHCPFIAWRWETRGKYPNAYQVRVGCCFWGSFDAVLVEQRGSATLKVDEPADCRLSQGPMVIRLRREEEETDDGRSDL